MNRKQSIEPLIHPKNDLGVDKTFYEQIVEYCNEHFLVLVEKDVWEDAEKALTTKNNLAVDKLISDCEKMSFDIDFFNKPLKVVALDAVKNIVNDLPTVTPQEPRWIPVSKKLPKLVEWYLTSIKWVDGTERVTISWFDGTSFKAEVKAWMPLPKPYKEVEE